MWKIEVEKLSSIIAALEARKRELETELAPKGFGSLKARAPELYIAYLKNSVPGPYPITSPCPWPLLDRPTLLAVLNAAAQYSPASAVYARVFIAARDRRGVAHCPIGRIDLRLASRLPEPEPIPPKRPALEAAASCPKENSSAGRKKPKRHRKLTKW